MIETMLLQALSGVDASLKKNSEILQNPSLEAALNTQFLFQIGIFTAVPMIVNLILEEGILKVCSSPCGSAVVHNLIFENCYLRDKPNLQFWSQKSVLILQLVMTLGGRFQAIISFCTMQLQLASVFFTFSLGTRTHYFGRTILHGGAKVPDLCPLLLKCSLIYLLVFADSEM